MRKIFKKDLSLFLMFTVSILAVRCGFSSDSLTKDVGVEINIDAFADKIQHYWSSSAASLKGIEGETVVNQLQKAKAMLPKGGAVVDGVRIDGDFIDFYVKQSQRHHLKTDKIGDLLKAYGVRADAPLPEGTYRMITQAAHNFLKNKKQIDASLSPTGFSLAVDCRAASGAALGCSIASGVSCALVVVPYIGIAAAVLCAVTTACGVATTVTQAVGYCSQSNPSGTNPDFYTNNAQGTVSLQELQTQQNNECRNGANCQNVGGNFTGTLVVNRNTGGSGGGG